MTDHAMVERAIGLAKTIGRGVQGGDEDLWLSCDLTLPQLKCLFVVSRHGPISIGGIAHLLDIGLPSASSLVDRLVEQGFVDRHEDPRDRRRTLASATTSGAALAWQLREGSLAKASEWLQALSPADLAALVQGLEAVVRVAELSTPQLIPEN